jgi:hypothetical protein
MTANTTRGITYPTGTDQVAPLHTVFATMATSIDTALGKIVFKAADHTALAALTGMTTGDLASVTEGGAIFRYSGIAWVQATPATFASAASRDTAYAKASAVYRTPGAQVYLTDTSTALIRIGTDWRPVRANTTGAYRVYAAQTTWTNQTGSLGLLTGADLTGASANFTKWGAATRLKVTISASAELGSGVAQVVYAGLRINNVDYTIAQRRFEQAIYRSNIVGVAFLTGVPAFTGSIQPGFRTATASVLNVYPGDDFISWSVEEVD